MQPQVQRREHGPLSLREIIERLATSYGPQDWWPAENRFEMIVGAILTQRVSWTHVERAIERLREAQRLSIEALLATPQAELSDLIRPALYHNAKARKLQEFCRFAVRNGATGIDLSTLLALPARDLRAALLNVHGIGPETADAVLLYAAGRPAFVVDAYARRILTRLRWINPRTPDETIRSKAMAGLSYDVTALGEAHALLVEHGKRHCRKRAPRCVRCALQRECPFGNTQCDLAWSEQDDND